MTNQNPASSQSPLNREILAKVNAHADRSIDRLFTDIDELLSGDLEDDIQSSAIQHAGYRGYSTDQSYYTNYPRPQNLNYPSQSVGSDFDDNHQHSDHLSAELIDPPQSTPTKPKRQLPLWLKVLVGAGITGAAAGGLLTWLVNEGKIELPQSIDTSWVPFQSQPGISANDAKFADYMQKSVAKIESDAKIQAIIATNPPATPVNPTVDPTTQTTAQPIAVTPNSTRVTPTATRLLPQSATKSATKKIIALVKTIPTSGRQSAIFEIDRQSKTVKIGQKIGTSDWSLLNVTKTEVFVKRKGGEVRSVQVGQKL
jgi:hypothetical protein